MNRGRVDGFTVIETMLFLAVSGVLIVGILVASGGAINAQRYKDAVNSLASFFQGEYDRVANVQNLRDSDLTCAPGDASLSIGDGSSFRGTTDCVIMGRLLTSSEQGDLINAQTVYGSVDLSNVFSESGVQLNGDAAAITGSNLFIDGELGDSNEYRPEWSTRLVTPRSTEPDRWQILIVRSPASGSLRTYVSSDTGLTLQELVNANNEQERLVCLDSRGLVFSGNRGVSFSARATGASAVTTLGDGRC